MNPTIQPLRHGLGFRLISAPSSSMNQQLSSTTSLRQKILCKNKSNIQSSSSTSSSGRGSRGKRGHALKFHNFVANDCHSNVSNACLREENGTKQITVSHWSIKDSPDESEGINEEKGSEETSSRVVSDEEKQKSILESLLASRMLNQTRHDPMIGEGEGSATLATKRKRSKRKPSIVRRVIHDSDDEEAKYHVNRQVGSYGVQNETKSVNDVQDEPLDLSKKKKMKFEEQTILSNVREERFGSTGQYSKMTNNHKLKQRRPQESFVSESGRNMRDPIEHLIQAVGESAARAASIMASVSNSNHQNSTGVFSVNQPPNYYNSMCERNGRGVGVTQLDPSSSQGSNFTGQVCIDPSSPGMDEACLSSDAQQEQEQQRLLQKQSTQRNVIKQKLEDAFKTNGFLVKTKQVSDGDATFCKFRQLRKYTRYYLKSWHKHLPDEVNKLYKGFLPPNSNNNNKLNGCNNEPE